MSPISHIHVMEGNTEGITFTLVSLMRKTKPSQAQHWPSTAHSRDGKAGTQARAGHTALSPTATALRPWLPSGGRSQTGEWMEGWRQMQRWADKRQESMEVGTQAGNYKKGWLAIMHLYFNYVFQVGKGENGC